MKIKLFLTSFCTMALLLSCAEKKESPATINISVSEEISSSFKDNGRLFIYFSESERREPRYQSGINSGSYVLAKNISSWNGAQEISIPLDDELMVTRNWKNAENTTMHVQVLWDQNSGESRVNTPGNLYSEVKEIDINNTSTHSFSLQKMIPERTVDKNDYSYEFEMESKLLSDWWKKPMKLKASVLVPSGFDPTASKKYPVRYNVAGYGGRYTRINRLVNNKQFMDWWTSDDAPQIITVFLDGEGPFGDSYQLDSENNGPYGAALTEELIPAIEREFHISGNSKDRFVDGCSTGGWVSLALQLFYPDVFNGCWSYSPDPVSFYKMQLINMYEDENAFINSSGLKRPSRRDIFGEPDFTIEQEIISENVQGYNNTYVTSGGQWGAWNAVYSPKGSDGLPKAAFDPVTGNIDKEVAEHWKKYDLLKLLEENWNELGPKLQGKINIWMGDMDNYYLNTSMRDFDAFLKNTKNPTSDANIVFSAMEGHCTKYGHRQILEEINLKIKQ